MPFPTGSVHVSAARSQDPIIQEVSQKDATRPEPRVWTSDKAIIFASTPKTQICRAEDIPTTLKRAYSDNTWCSSHEGNAVLSEVRPHPVNRARVKQQHRPKTSTTTAADTNTSGKQKAFCVSFLKQVVDSSVSQKQLRPRILEIPVRSCEYRTSNGTAFSRDSRTQSKRLRGRTSQRFSRYWGPYSRDRVGQRSALGNSPEGLAPDGALERLPENDPSHDRRIDHFRHLQVLNIAASHIISSQASICKGESRSESKASTQAEHLSLGMWYRSLLTRLRAHHDGYLDLKRALINSPEASYQIRLQRLFGIFLYENLGVNAAGGLQSQTPQNLSTLSRDGIWSIPQSSRRLQIAYMRATSLMASHGTQNVLQTFRSLLRLRRVISTTRSHRAIQTLPSLADHTPGEHPPFIEEASTLPQLQYHLSQAALDAAKSSAGSAPLYWDHTLYRNASDRPPTVTVCLDKQSTDLALLTLADSPVLGLDLEWQCNSRHSAGIKSNISLVQLASESQIVLIHLARFPGSNTRLDLVPKSLKLLLEDISITKAGVAIRGDCTRLHTHLGIRTKSMFELSHMHKLVKYGNGPVSEVKLINKTMINLALQAQEHFNIPLRKDPNVRAGNWAVPMNLTQIKYAASDAYICHRLFYVLDEKRRAMDPRPPRPGHVDDEKPILLAGGKTPAEYCLEHGGKVLPEVLQDEAGVEEEVPPAEEEKGKEELARQFGALTTDEEGDEGLKARSEAVETTVEGTVEYPSIPIPTTASTSSSSAQRRPTNSTATTAKRPPFSSTPHPFIIAATSFSVTLRSSLLLTESSRPALFGDRRTPQPAELKAYYLWHHKGLDLLEVCGILRDPPLKVGTVARYIVQAVRIGRLEHEGERFKVVVAEVPRIGGWAGKGKGRGR